MVSLGQGGKAHRQDVAIVGVQPSLDNVARLVELYDVDIVAPGEEVRDFLDSILLRLLVCGHRVRAEARFRSPLNLRCGSEGDDLEGCQHRIRYLRAE